MLNNIQDIHRWRETIQGEIGLVSRQNTDVQGGGTTGLVQGKGACPRYNVQDDMIYRIYSYDIQDLIQRIYTYQ